MRFLRPFRGVVYLILVLQLAWASGAFAREAVGTRGIVSSVNPLATEAGLRVLKSGGNAVDAAVAVGLTLGVVDGHNSGIGGGAFMLIRTADGKLVALDGRETAPAGATRDMYIRQGSADTDLSQNGALAVAVPGALALYETALREHGRKSLSELIGSAAEIAERGFPMNPEYARRLAGNADLLRRFEGTRRMFFRAAGEPLRAGDMLRQPDLARSYRAIAQQGVKWFYDGEYAAAVASWMRENRGILTAEDFHGYHIKHRTPISTTYREFVIVGFPPPSSGGVHVAQILNILECFDLAQLGTPGDRYHVIAEAMKLAFADRAHWLGDPDFSDVPRGLVEKSYARELAARIRMDETLQTVEHGTPPAAAPRYFEKHTTHFSVADAEGNWVACTQTINTSFGSKVIVPGTGILLNDEMDDFSAQPGVPNAFHLVGAESNAIAPHKRPLSSMSPTIVLKEGQPILALGAAGGPTIISQTVLNLVGILDLRMPLDAALGQPRIHHQWRPDELRIETTLPATIQTALRNRGHRLVEENGYGVSQVIGRGPDGLTFIGAADPRADGTAAGW